MFESGLSGLPKEKHRQHQQEGVQCQRQPDIQMQDLRCEIP